MPVIDLSDLSDPRLEPFRQIKVERREWARRYFIAEGGLLWERLLASPFTVKAVVIAERFREQVVSQAPPECHIYVIPDNLFAELVGFKFHRGILAQGCRREPVPMQSTLRPPGSGTVVVCPQIQDPENLGSILRVAAAFGAWGVIVGPSCPDPWSRRVLRVSMGASLRMPIWPVEEMDSLLRQTLPSLKFVPVATTLGHGATSLDQFVWPERTALVLGREDQGLSADVIAACSLAVNIPMHTGTDSLNVAVAAGIMLHAISYGT